MALDLSTGTDVALKRAADGKHFDLDLVTAGAQKGNPRLDFTRTHAVVATLNSNKRGRRPGDKTSGGGYFFDETGRRGTLLWTVSQDTSKTRSEMIAAGQDAGQQLTDERYVTAFTADATRRRVGAWALLFTWTLPSGDRRELP